MFSISSFIYERSRLKLNATARLLEDIKSILFLLKSMRKHTKEMALIFLGFLFIILIVDFFFLNREGLSVGGVGTPSLDKCEYRYLNPVSYENGKVKEWSIETQDKYIEKYNAINSIDDPNNTLDREKFKELNSILNISEEEGKHYADNGKYPLNPYIINTLKNDEKVKESLNKRIKESKIKLTPDTINKVYSVRMIYTSIIAPTEPTDTPTLAREIFNGTAVGPDCEEKKGSDSSPLSGKSKEVSAGSSYSGGDKGSSGTSSFSGANNGSSSGSMSGSGNVREVCVKINN